MKKLRLDLDSLSVQTFEPEAALTQTRRTVFGNEVTEEFCAPGSTGIINACYTWYMNDANCAFSLNWRDGDNCTPVCQTGENICPSLAPGCETGLCLLTDPVECG